jgi:hypothetical protein
MPMNIIRSFEQWSNRNPHYNNALGRRVVRVFRVDAIMCCELEGGYLVGGQIAIEHGNVEIVLDQITHLPEEFAPALHASHPMQMWLIGRKFRGLQACSMSGNVAINFGRYALLFVRDSGITTIGIGMDKPEHCDLPEDAHLSITEQFTCIEELAAREFLTGHQ